MKFNFIDYKKFCRENNLKENEAKNLFRFKQEVENQPLRELTVDEKNEVIFNYRPCITKIVVTSLRIRY